jgi:hypothetical protein
VRVFDVGLTIDAAMSRSIIEVNSESGRQLWIPGEYFVKGKIREVRAAVAQKLKRYIGYGEMLVDFVEFRLKCRIIDDEWNIESVGPEVDGKSPEELWDRSGGAST